MPKRKRGSTRTLARKRGTRSARKTNASRRAAASRRRRRRSYGRLPVFNPIPQTSLRPKVLVKHSYHWTGALDADVDNAQTFHINSPWDPNFTAALGNSASFYGTMSVKYEHHRVIRCWWTIRAKDGPSLTDEGAHQSGVLGTYYPLPNRKDVMLTTEISKRSLPNYAEWNQDETHRIMTQRYTGVRKQRLSAINKQVVFKQDVETKKWLDGDRFYDTVAGDALPGSKLYLHLVAHKLGDQQQGRDNIEVDVVLNYLTEWSHARHDIDEGITGVGGDNV